MSKSLASDGEVLFQGITVNEFSADNDYTRAAAAGIGAAVLRATAGDDYTDSGLAKTVQAIRAAGIRLGFYHYLLADSSAAARAQALFFADVVRSYSATLRPAMLFDMLNGLSFDSANEIAAAFLSTLAEASGVTPAIYTDAQSANLLWNKSLAERYPLWVIEQTDAAQPDVGASPWSGWAGWQYATTDNVPGLRDHLPLSRFTAAMLSSQIVLPDLREEAQVGDDKLICVTTVYGDTLSGIARLFNTSVESIVRLNGIADPNRIFPGQRLYLRVAKSVPIVCCDSYTVRKNDTLSGIAERFSTSWQRLASINEIANPDLVQPGQVLKLGLCN